MISYNINICNGDETNNEYKYIAVVGVYKDGVNIEGCYIAENECKKLMEYLKQTILKYERKYK